MNHIKQLVDTLLIHQNDWQRTLLTKWQDIMGNLADKVVLEGIKQDTLILGVYDSCWLQELYLLSPMLLKTINANLDAPHVKQLRFKKIAKKKKEKKKGKTYWDFKKTRSLDKHEQSALKKIKDPDLAKALEGFLIRCYRES